MAGGLKTELKLNHVSKSFARADRDGITHALQDVNLTINDGEFVCIVGASGCGKSTILRLIAGLIPPTSGTLTLNGELIDGTSAKRGMVFQAPTLFPWLTVGENVAFGLNVQNKKEELHRVDELLDMIGLSEFKDSYPNQLSGGMAQRVSLIRTMINEPAVFLLDEPLGALDAFTRMNIQDELISLWLQKRNTMIMVTHDVDEAIYMSTRIIVMAPRPGRVLKDIKIDLEEGFRNRISDEFLEYRKIIMDLLDMGHKEGNLNEQIN
ncbi:MAG: ABC transporter ATP-binding protein [Ezakiella sp.]|uniref:ABC transporter ATP-binding protein n=1 Tax=Ezakiella sp. TaxID=1935205 RepID=UPI00297A5F2A|nr:ABC transporter ATP-binding protein [Ezakiella sp.]MDD7731811.1 ABC transporter ATP-binding protein [Eubacteriales bacterium]MDY6079263.1 ABC transporter ATP-binding protein [Ezakiella sp.]